jgi:tellurite resistance protein TehA-like permease
MARSLTAATVFLVIGTVLWVGLTYTIFAALTVKHDKPPLQEGLTWQHLIRRFPLRYDPLYWGAVFPLSMYAVATKQMAAALELPFLAPIPPVVFVAALAA